MRDTLMLPALREAWGRAPGLDLSVQHGLAVQEGVDARVASGQCVPWCLILSRSVAGARW